MLKFLGRPFDIRNGFRRLRRCSRAWVNVSAFLGSQHPPFAGRIFDVIQLKTHGEDVRIECGNRQFEGSAKLAPSRSVLGRNAFSCDLQDHRQMIAELSLMLEDIAPWL